MGLMVCAAWGMVGVMLFVLFAMVRPMTDMTLISIIMIIIAIVIPIAVIGTIVSSSRSIRIMREESQSLRAAIEHIQQSFDEDAKLRKSGLQPSVERKLADIASAARQAEAAAAVFSTTRKKRSGLNTLAMAPVSVPDNEPALDLDLEKPKDDKIGHEILIKALNFPDDEGDKQGFHALRHALEFREISRLIQSSQDVLTALAEDGIFMDDLRPDRARPDLWRRFAQGEKGPMTAALGGVRDRTSLALTSGRMRSDTVFQDTVHNFLLRFDRLLQDIEADMTDAELSALTHTRTAKAFMLLGRVTGMFV